MTLFGFDEESAKRIGQTVRLVEGDRTRRANAGADIGRGGLGVRCMLANIGTNAWSQNSSAVVNIYTGAPNTTYFAETVVAHNYTRDIAADQTSDGWVLVSNNGYGWLLQDAADDDFRIARNTEPWAVDSSAAIEFVNSRYSNATTTAYNNFCSIGVGGEVGVSLDVDGVWQLVSWETGEDCGTQVVDVIIYFDDETCAVSKTVVTATQKFLTLTYPYTTCS